MLNLAFSSSVSDHCEIPSSRFSYPKVYIIQSVSANFVVDVDDGTEWSLKCPSFREVFFLSRSSRFAWFPEVVLYILPQSLLNRLGDFAAIHCEWNFRSLPLPSADETFSVDSFWLTTAREREYMHFQIPFQC